MKNIWKRSLSMLLALVLVLGMVPVSTLAAVAGTTDVSGEVNIISVGPDEAKKISESELYAWLKTMYGDAYEGTSGGYKYTGGSVTDKNIRDTLIRDPSASEGSAKLAKDTLYTVQVAYLDGRSVKWKTETKQFKVVEVAAAADIRVRDDQDVRYYTGMDSSAVKNNIFAAIYDSEKSTPNNLTAADVIIEVNVVVEVEGYTLYNG